MTIDQLTGFATGGLAILGVVTIIAAGVKGILYLIKPFTNINDKVEGFGKMLDNDKRRLDKLEASLDEINEGLSIVGLALAEFINHEITGNDTEELKKQQSKINEFFFKGAKQ